MVVVAKGHTLQVRVVDPRDCVSLGGCIVFLMVTTGNNVFELAWKTLDALNYARNDFLEAPDKYIPK